MLHHASKVGEWRELARYEKFGVASIVCDELMARGIPCRLRAEISNIDLAHSSQFHVEGGRPYQALDVSADFFGEAVEALAAIRAQEADDDIEPDVPNPIVDKTASALFLLVGLAFGAVILIAVLGAVASWADERFFGG
jgi:hypothetical protein